MTRAPRTDASRRRTRRALVVEDDPALQRLLRELMSASGWQAEGFRRLAAARRSVHQRPPDLLVIDDDLPDGRGGDLVAELRRSPATRHLPIVFCTSADPDRCREIAELGPVVEKPFRLRDLERAIAQVEREVGDGR